MSFNVEVFEKTAVKLLTTASVRLPPDVRDALRAAYDKETSPAGKIELKNIIDNFGSAEKLVKPMCQDTGLVSYYIKSREFPNYGAIRDALFRAAAEATKGIPLRPNAVHPLTRKNTGNNLGEYTPVINWLYEDIDHVELTVTVKGGGSENMSALAMIQPSAGVKGIKKFIIDTIASAGGKPCPPTILGIGIGGWGVDTTMKMAKFAQLRTIGQRNKNPDISKLETDLLELVNETGVGPMGLGGRTTSLDVKIECGHCHTASLPVGLNPMCWADRKATAKIHPDKTVEYLF